MYYTLILTRLNTNLVDNGKSFRFGYKGDSDEYGYYKADDSFVPFSNSDFILILNQVVNGNNYVNYTVEDLSQYKHLIFTITGSEITPNKDFHNGDNGSQTAYILYDSFKNTEIAMHWNYGTSDNTAYVKYIDDTTVSIKCGRNTNKRIAIIGIK